MKVITIKQPWASLIAEGYKEYEFRTWKTKHRGEILIHAGKGVDRKAMKRFVHLNLEYPAGCIIAKANLTDCVYIDEDMAKMLQAKDNLVYYGFIDKVSNTGNYEKVWEGYGFKLEDVKKIDPIFVNGQLSLWDYDYDDGKTKQNFSNEQLSLWDCDNKE